MTSGPNHRLVERARRQMEQGGLDRRQFVRLAALFGLGAASAYGLAGLSAPAQANTLADSPFPAVDADATRGGVLRIGMGVQKMDDPALFSWGEMANQARQVLDYVALTGADNITRPMLAAGWSPSDDLKTWVITFREGVTWHNGDPFTAEDVAWNVRRWLDATLGSANIGLSTFSALVEETGEREEDGTPVRRPIAGAVEVVDPLTLRLNLAKPVLSVPEDFSNFSCPIVHPSFTAPWSDNPIGTGAYTLKELVVGERCILERMTTRADGEAFAYWGGDVLLDEIHYYDFSVDNQLLALAGGDVDAIFEFGPEQKPLAESFPGKILPVETAYCLVCRMRMDTAPFDDVRVRKAVQLSIDNVEIAAIVFADDAQTGENHHVSPVHPEYFDLPKTTRDVDGAKALLAEAGYADGIDLTIDVGNTDGVWQQSVCEAMRDQMADAGIRLTVNLMPATKYWEVWTETPFGATSWAHRPLGTMVLSQAYRSGVPWNESRFSNPEFDAALDAAEAIFDPDERRQKMETVERLLQDSGAIVQPLWRPIYTMTADKVHGFPAHPSKYHVLNATWVES
ncbi:ABC transporter substrate-binding protein [Stappia sp.]|uniref:ABC transporter substrate-binding protein n=1 Tax=Stappia sp. TaxID=1870903 RepID=UPI003C7EBB85